MAVGDNLLLGLTPAPDRGVQSVFQLDSLQLVAEVEFLGDTTYYNDPANWDKVIMFYRSNTSNQKSYVVFNADGVTDPSATFDISAVSVGDFFVEYVVIRDFDGGYFKFNKGAMSPGQLTQMDVVIATVAGFGTEAMLFDADARFEETNISGWTYTEWAISVWYKHDTGQTINGSYGNLITGNIFGGNFSSVSSLNIGVAPDGTAQVAGADLGTIKIATTTDISDGTWHHLLMTRSGTTTSLYVDDVLEVNTTNVTNANMNGIAIGNPYPSLGVSAAGYIAQADYFGSAFSGAQVTSMFNSGVVKDPSTFVTDLGVDAVSSLTFGDEVGNGDIGGGAGVAQIYDTKRSVLLTYKAEWPGSISIASNNSPGI